MSTIVALSTGKGRAALAVVRVSGPAVPYVFTRLLGRTPASRRATLVTLADPDTGAVIDRCLACYFPAPFSATGEHVLELSLHGGTAVIEAALQAVLGSHDTVRLAEPGEFSRRALENGKLELLQVEALGDLLEAETGRQLAQAQRQLGGELGRLALRWQEALVEARALVEAELDFSDEGDVGSGLVGQSQVLVSEIAEGVRQVLANARQGQRIREGVSVVLAGPPNVGKSSLMNVLANSDVSIVSDRPGTTRDIVERTVVLDGWPICLADAAGLRTATDAIEAEGIRRAQAKISESDIVLRLCSADTGLVDPADTGAAAVINVWTKSDLVAAPPGWLSVSTVNGQGVAQLRGRITEVIAGQTSGEPALVSRERQRIALTTALLAIERAACGTEAELIAEELRLASAGLSQLVGHTDLDSVLDSLFAGFCIGK